LRFERTHKQDKLARVYDDEILPLWTQRFGRMILRELGEGTRNMVLDVGCGSGYATTELLRRLGDARIVAVEPISALLDLARKKVGPLAGKRAFFRTEAIEPRLSFADQVYDLVVANLVLGDVRDPEHTLRDLVRVTKVGGRVLATLPLRGTWEEFLDLFREVLIKHDQHDSLERLDAHLATFPEAEEVGTWMEHAGLSDGRVEIEEYTLLFRSSREFFFAPLVEFGPLSAWKAVAGKGEEMQDVFWHVKEAIDTYFRDRAFAVTVKAGCLVGTRSEETLPASSVRIHRVAAAREQVEAHTGEIEVSEMDVESAAELGERLEAVPDFDEDSGVNPPADPDAPSALDKDGDGQTDTELQPVVDADLPADEEPQEDGDDGDDDALDPDGDPDGAGDPPNDDSHQAQGTPPPRSRRN
jgi:ubiquinone/menaquinone biosynthesis C-methylase UbiE